MPGIIASHDSPGAPDSRAREIRDYVSRLLATAEFPAASRRGQLLQYLVQHTLDGDSDQINEYAIGLDVFRRPTSFDPRIESVVRTEFSRLRQRLKEYYADDGRGDTIVIDFPPRSYTANIEFRDATAIAAAAANATESAKANAGLSPTQTAQPAGRSSRTGAKLAVTGIVAIALAGLTLWRLHVPDAALVKPINAIVVLPFQNYSPNHQDEYIADGMTEELTNDLAQWRDLRVVARTSAFAFKDKGEDVRKIGEQLSVDAVLEGSFTKVGDRVRITAQLNRTADGYHLWSHSYETQSSDLLSLQEEVANSITAEIQQIRGGTPPAIRAVTSNPEAHDLFMQGKFQFNLRTPESLKKSEELFDAAVAKDPSFASAYLGIAKAEISEISLTTTTNEKTVPRIRQAAQKAIELDPKLGEAYALVAYIDYVWDWNWDAAEVEFKRALELGADPETSAQYGWSLTTRGRFSEAHQQFLLTAEQDPLSILSPFDEFFTYNFERDLMGQKKSIQQMLKIRPNFLGAHALSEVLDVQQRDCHAARSEADWIEKNFPTVPLTQSTVAFAAACEGNKAEALSRIKKMADANAPAYQLAIAYALLHDSDNTRAELTRSADAHEGQILYLKYDPFFDEIRNDPRYVALEKRVGLL